MTPYAQIFTVVYLLLTVVFAVILTIFEFGGASFNLVLAFAASCFAAARFFKAHGRRPTRPELSAYSWAALAGALGGSLLLVIGAYFLMPPSVEFDALFKMMASGIFLAMLGGIMAIISTVYFFAIRWSFSWYVNQACKRIEAKLGQSAQRAG